MASPHPKTSDNAIGRDNLFADHNAERDVRSASPTPRRPTLPGRRGAVLPVDDPCAPAAPRAARVARTHIRLAGVSTNARRLIARADHNAQRLLGYVLARRHGALCALSVVAALVLAIGWLALSLRGVHATLDDTHAKQEGTAVALRHARARAHMLTIERDRTRATASTARRDQARAASAASSWRRRAHVAQRRLSRERRHHSPRKSR